MPAVGTGSIGMPFYSVYPSSDGCHLAVGALEPKFFAELLRALEVPDCDMRADQQLDRNALPAKREISPRSSRSGRGTHGSITIDLQDGVATESDPRSWRSARCARIGSGDYGREPSAYAYCQAL